MSRGLYSALMLTLVARGSGQFLRSWSGGLSYSSQSYSSHGGFHSWTSSFSKATSLTRGMDGHVHQKVHESHSESTSNSQGTQRVESTTLCADGLCKEEIVKSRRAPDHKVVWPERIPTAFEALMDLYRVRSRPRMESGLFALEQGQDPQPVFHIASVSAQPVVVVPLRPSFRGSPTSISDAIKARPTFHSVSQLRPAGGSLPDKLLISISLFLGLITTLLSVFFILKRCRAASARTLRPLAEPLAPTQEVLPAVCRAQTPPCPAPTPTKKYLLGVYTRAQERIDFSLAQAERKGIQQYLHDLYQRAVV